LELNQAVYSQRDATFRGGEFQFQWDTLPMWHGFWGVDGQYDFVRVTFADGTNVPRISPQRIGRGVYLRSAEWFGRVSLLYAFAQNDIAIVGVLGNNLLNEDIRNHVSYTKDQVLMPGASAPWPLIGANGG
jgi:iron complex outermembrane recepter protein